MAVMRSSSNGSGGTSSSNSYNLRLKDSDPSLDGSKHFCSKVGSIGDFGFNLGDFKPRAKDKAKPKEFEYTSKKPWERKYTSKDGDDVVNPLEIDHEGTKYELVEPGCITSVLLLTCFFYHIDFTAKKTDVADAPEKIFFAELKTTYKVRVVELCKSMGPKSLIT
ncbi:hypothetical protein MKW98_023908, partial [Papaver atlanticum]